MLTFDLTLKKNYKIEANSLKEAVAKLKKIAEDQRDILIENEDIPTVITETHEDIKLTEFWG